METKFYKGYQIDLAIHPKLYGNYEIHKGDFFISRALNLKDAKVIINKHLKESI